MGKFPRIAKPKSCADSVSRASRRARPGWTPGRLRRFETRLKSVKASADTTAVALNAERAAEETRGLMCWLRPDYQAKRAGVAQEAEAAPDEEQLEAPLSAPPAKAQKPSFPTGDLERTATVFSALMGAGGPLDAQTIAKGFRHGAKIEPAIARVLASLARLGHVHAADGRGYALRRIA
jgi:hypothetical protein